MGKPGKEKGREWYIDHRMAWIAEMLDIYGFINRDHVVRKFGISEPQVALDFRLFKQRYPNVMIYNESAKRYEKTDGKTEETQDVHIRLRRRASSGGNDHEPE